ncbi:molybdopterin oxidoreductase family protein [Mycobacterium xenopi 3993]|nr:molybdopterin oxidoreductase family protein [Mycobacterium xenopi 3993]
MTSTCTYSDIVLPAATWYEKYDISTTDMHPFVHSFNPAIPPRGRLAPTSTRSPPLPATSPGWPQSIWAHAPT